MSEPSDDLAHARAVVTQELASLFSVLSHPDRIRIIEELRAQECDVQSLADNIDVRQTRVSQHLAQLRAHRLVKMRRDGRHVFYRLASPPLARWLLKGVIFIEPELVHEENIHDAVEQALEDWSEGVAK
ncbi:MAG: metalloregulator ArsR/SmtB family transcription factor [Myxococcota bacterium]